MGDVQTVGAWFAAAEAMTVLTGGGISRDGGGSRNADSQGLWTRDPGSQRLFTLRDYVSDPDIRREAWQIRRAHAAWSARPTAAHYALVELETTGKLRALITQNIDGLHQLAGTSGDLVIEVHGSLYEVECLSCGARAAMSDTLERVAAGEEDPACLRCGGILKAGTISFGQPLVPEVFARAQAAASSCDVFLAVGTSLSVQPVAGLVDVAKKHKARVVIINPDRTPYDAVADAKLTDPIGDLPRLVAAAQASIASTG